MRIAIDARLNAYRRGGIPQYTRQLLTALSEIAIEEQFVSLQHRDMLRPLAVAPNVTRRTIYTPPHHRFERWILPFEVALARPDVLHFPDFIAPTYRPCPAVVTIHDLAFMHYPQILDDAARAFYQQVLTNTHRADAVIAVSEATRQDVVQFLDVPVDDIKVIYEAAAPMFRHMDLRTGEARVLNGKPVAAGTFMLFVSTLEPRKNLPTLLQALRICLDRSPSRPYKLVIVGGRGWNDEPIFEAIRDLRLADHVLLAGSVGQYDLRWLYNACQFYINPSLYEGFGLPLLEAMACGAACLAAATSSLPEIAGDAALYVPPLEPEQWADAMGALWDNTERQEELGRIGQARSQRFSWARAARETLQVYYHAAERHEQPVAPRIPSAIPARRTAQPPQPAVVLPSAAALESAERTCLRCSTPMLPGELQQHLRIQLASEDGSETPVQPRAWACPNCGYAELVVEPMVVPFADAVAAIPDGVDEDAEEPSQIEPAATAGRDDRDDVTAPLEEMQSSLPAQVFSDEDHASVAADDLAHDDDADEQFVVSETVVTGDDEAVDEDVVSDDLVDVSHEDRASEADASASASCEEQTAEQQSVDERISRDTAILPALERDETAEELTSEAVSEASDRILDEPVSRDTVVLPALERAQDDHEVAVDADNMGDDSEAMRATDSPVEELAEDDIEASQMAGEQPDTPMIEEPVETIAFDDENVQASEGITNSALETPSESHDEAQSSHVDAIQQEEYPGLHAHSDDVGATNGEGSNGVYELTPVQPGYRNGVSNLHVAEATPQHDSTNGLKDERLASAPKQWHGKRHVASAKISRASSKQSSSTTAGPDTGMSRGKNRSHRKK